MWEMDRKKWLANRLVTVVKVRSDSMYEWISNRACVAVIFIFRCGAG
jgi:hypothetical protein